MKSFCLLFLIFMVFDHVRCAATITRFDYIEVLCDNPPVVKEQTDVPHTSATLKKLTIAFTHTSLSDCYTPDKRILAGESTLFELTVSEKKIAELVYDENDGDLTKFYTTDAQDNRVAVNTFPKYLDMQRIAISIDLEKGLISASHLTAEGDAGEPLQFFTHASKSGLNYGTLAFDSTLKLSFPSFIQYADLVVEYDTYYTETSLLPFLLSPKKSALSGSYELKEGSGLSVADESETLGTMYLGKNGQDTNLIDGNMNPVWSTDGLDFSKSTQFTNIDVNARFGGDQADYNADHYGWIQSTGFNLWIKPKEKPTEVQKIIRQYKVDTAGTNEEVFAVSIDEESKIVISYEGKTVATSTEAVPVGEWTLLTVNLALIFGDYYYYAGTIYFGGTLQTPDNFYISEEAPSVKRRLSSEDDGVKLQIGNGFIGEIRSFMALTPGTTRINYPSSIAGCMIDLGLEDNVCFAEQCPNGKTTFPCSDDDEEEEKANKNDDDGLSVGALAGIIIGSVAFATILIVAIHFSIKRKGGKDNKAAKNYKIPETPTESAGIKNETQV